MRGVRGRAPPRGLRGERAVDMKTGFDSGRAAQLDAGRDGGGGAAAGASGALACAVETPPRAAQREAAAARLLGETSPPSTL